jgi:hypothetical protein
MPHHGRIGEVAAGGQVLALRRYKDVKERRKRPFVHPVEAKYPPLAAFLSGVEPVVSLGRIGHY